MEFSDGGGTSYHLHFTYQESKMFRSASWLLACILLTGSVASFVPNGALAQNMGGVVGFNNVTNSICGGSCERASRRNDRFVDPRALLRPAPQPDQRKDLARIDYTYRYDRNRTRENLNLFVKQSPTPQAAVELKKMLDAQPTIMDDIRQGIRPYGLDTHNVADAYAMWWINAWLAYKGLDQDTPRGTVAMVKAQVQNALAAVPDFANTTEADRQQFSEALLLQGLMAAAALDQLKGNPDHMRQLSAAVHKGALSMDVDLSKMDLTPNGFVPRKGADASEAGQDVLPDSAEPAQRASADGEGDSALALALAAGAGLGVVLLGGAAFMRRQG
ncbi:MAG: DUF6683 family protein [Pseudomonadota bacterium]|nr:DUF6683 family protein [Pseudomonadota bacterium]